MLTDCTDYDRSVGTATVDLYYCALFLFVYVVQTCQNCSNHACPSYLPASKGNYMTTALFQYRGRRDKWP